MARFRSLLLCLANTTFVVSFAVALLTFAANEAFATSSGPPPCALPPGCAAAPCPGTICTGTNCMGCTSNAKDTCSC
jgi:hypothetical protein